MEERTGEFDIVFRWLKQRRRSRVRNRPFPPDWLAILQRNVLHYTGLSEQEKMRLRQAVAVLIDEKHFEGCQGFEITDEVRVTIAGFAALLILNRPDEFYPSLKTILVYPEAFMVESDEPGPGDGHVVSVSTAEHSGESWDLGVVILAWDEVLRACRPSREAYNVVLHEFAHQLDLEDGEVDGVPLLAHGGLYDEWAEVFQRDFERHLRDVRHHRRTVIDEYGAVSPAEFFAVATETFFEQPVRLRRKHPELYNALRGYYGQDPGARVDRG